MRLILLFLFLSSLIHAQWFYTFVGDSKNDVEVAFGEPDVFDRKSDIYHYFNFEKGTSINFMFRGNRVVAAGLVVITLDKAGAQQTLKHFVKRFKENDLKLISQTETSASMRYGNINVSMLVEPAQKQYRLRCTAKK